MKSKEELPLPNLDVQLTQRRRQRRLSRANWWFEQMREIVDKAVDWQPRRKWKGDK